METRQLICRTNQLTGFYMMETLVVKGLNILAESQKSPNQNQWFSLKCAPCFLRMSFLLTSLFQVFLSKATNVAMAFMEIISFVNISSFQLSFL